MNPKGRASRQNKQRTDHALLGVYQRPPTTPPTPPERPHLHERPPHLHELLEILGLSSVVERRRVAPVDESEMRPARMGQRLSNDGYGSRIAKSALSERKPAQNDRGLSDAGLSSRIANFGLPETEPSDMDESERGAWASARTAGVVDRGCLLVWVVASANASKDRCSYDHDHLGSGSETGLDSTRGATRHDCVPWECLKGGLLRHLSGKLTVPSSQLRVGVDESTHGCVARTGEEDDEDGEGGMSGDEASGNGGGDSNEERLLNDRELDFVRLILKNKQDSLSPQYRPSGATGRRGDGDVNADMITVEEYAAFSLWWAPLMRTLSIVERDWQATDPIRVHGFVGRIVADLELKRRKPGTFLLRFSETEPGALVVSLRGHVSC